MDEDEEKAELNDRIQKWIQDSSSDDNQPQRITKFPLDPVPVQLALPQVQRQQMMPRQSNPESVIVMESKNRAEPLSIVESFVAMVIAPLNQMPQLVDQDNYNNNPLTEFHSKLANIVPEGIENIRVHTQNLLVWK